MEIAFQSPMLEENFEECHFLVLILFSQAIKVIDLNVYFIRNYRNSVSGTLAF